MAVPASRGGPMIDLSTTYLGLQLRTPLVASASPLSQEIDGIRRLEDAGASAVVLYSLFEEQLRQEKLELEHRLSAGTERRCSSSNFSWRNCSSNREYKTTAEAPASSRRRMPSISWDNGDAEATSGVRSCRPR